MPYGKCHFISFPVFIKNLLNKKDQNILNKLICTGLPPAERYHSCPEDLQCMYIILEKTSEN